VNLLLLSRPEVAGGDRVALSGRRARHIREVLRASVGDTLRVGVVRGPRGEASVLEVEGDRVVLELARDPATGRALALAPSPTPRVSLVLALPRPKVLGRALEAAAASGVARIDLINAWRVDKAYFESPRLARAALEEHLWLGCEQGATTYLPEVAIHRRLMPFLDAPSPWPDGARLLLAHPRAESPLEAAAPPGEGGACVLAIGPEGGFIERELDSFVARGYRAVSLGAAVLRTEHAVAAALGPARAPRSTAGRAGLRSSPSAPLSRGAELRATAAACYS
jgi:16S rRNA (uracil1498-N3)-methyltransferase